MSVGYPIILTYFTHVKFATEKLLGFGKLEIREKHAQLRRNLTHKGKRSETSEQMRKQDRQGHVTHVMSWLSLKIGPSGEVAVPVPRRVEGPTNCQCRGAMSM